MSNAAQDAFIAKARAVHGEKYEYARDYVNARTKVQITCPEHGAFEQTPNNHLRGKGCAACARERAKGRGRKSQEQFIHELFDKWGDAYDYSAVNYTGAYEPVTLICREHGPTTKPAREWYRFGCYRCGGVGRGLKRQLSSEEFIERAKAVHGDRYSYEKTNYVAMGEKVYVECREHGGFWQRAQTHLKGSGCPKCAAQFAADGNGRRMSLEEFIARADAVHDGYYDYSETVYTGNNKLLTIICPVHGKIEQYAGNHLKGHGCKFCAGFGRTTEQFIEQAFAVHGDTYDYSQSNFKGVDQYITIVCKTHGPFDQRALGHLHGKGCAKCQADAQRFTRDEFIERAREVHGDRYDYSKVVYGCDNTAKVTITCPTHGDFEQKASSHLSGNGCQLCVFDAKTRTQEEFIAEAREIHGQRYDYSKTQYKGSPRPVTITCPIHGDFEQEAATHLRGSGCPECNTVGQYSIKAALRGDYAPAGVEEERRYIYVAKQRRDGEPDFLNIGIAKSGYKVRYGSGHPYETEGEPDRLYLPVTLAALAEQTVLRATAAYRYKPQIPFVGGARECRTMEALELIEEIIEDFAQDPARVVDSKWLEEEARRSGMLDALDSFKAKYLPTMQTDEGCFRPAAGAIRSDPESRREEPIGSSSQPAQLSGIGGKKDAAAEGANKGVQYH